MLARVLVAVLVAAGALGSGGVAARAKQEPAPAPACTPRILVLGAMPTELDMILTAAQLDRSATVDSEGRRFYVGTLAGNDVVIALSGIGLLNAEKVTRDAYKHFGCGDGSGISSIAFSGVAGGRYIGDVAVPTRWTLDDQTWFEVDKSMLRTARIVARRGVQLDRAVPLGDPACACTDPGLVKPVDLPRQPEVVIGGDGFSSDPFGGRMLPCAPNGGDVFGCEPCREQSGNPPDFQAFLTGAVPFIDPAFIAGFFENPPAADAKHAATDMETAAVAKVAAEYGTPFIGFRAASDGGGDPLMLPGFPFQFFVYRHLAADNAARMTIAFLEEWSSKAST